MDLEELLKPISDELPCGQYLKLDRSAYRGLRNAYNTAQSSFRQLIETPDASSDQDLLETNDSNWRALREVTFDALTKQTKDLEFLGWFIASQLFTSSPYENLAQSISLIEKYCEEYWPTLNPMPPVEKLKASDDAGQQAEWAEFRTKPLLQLVGESQDSTAIFVPLQMLSLIGDLTFGDYLRSERSGALSELKEKANLEYNSSVQETLMELSACYQALTAAEQSVAKKCQESGARQISFRFIKQNIEELIKAIQFLVGEKISPWPLDEQYEKIDFSAQQATQEAVEQTAQSASQSLEESGSATVQDQATTAQPNAQNQLNQQAAIQQVVQVSAQQVYNRDQAFAELRRLADFFKKTEPHSPIAFLLERAIRWGYMSLPELMQEMLGQNSQTLGQVNLLTGMDNLTVVDIDESMAATAFVSTPTSAPSPNTEPSSNANEAVSVPEPAAQPVATPEPAPSDSSDGLSDFEW